MASYGHSPLQYVPNTELFLDFVVDQLQWKDLKGQLVLDVGCGNPKIKLADLLLQKFPDLERVIAIDNQEHLIRYIKCKKPHRQIEHRVADIEKRSDFIEFKGSVDKVLSVHCFHMVPDQAKAFGNVFFVLRPGGEAAFVFCLSSGYAAWFSEITQDFKWRKYYNGNSPSIPVTQFENVNAEFYSMLLQKEGFEVNYCEVDKIPMPYSSDQNCKESLVKLSQSAFSVPEELKDEFVSYLFKTYTRHNELDDQGRPCQISHYVTAIVRKPRDEAEASCSR